jgi:hypothetical protein
MGLDGLSEVSGVGVGGGPGGGGVQTVDSSMDHLHMHVIGVAIQAMQAARGAASAAAFVSSDQAGHSVNYGAHGRGRQARGGRTGGATRGRGRGLAAAVTSAPDLPMDFSYALAGQGVSANTNGAYIVGGGQAAGAMPSVPVHVPVHTSGQDVDMAESDEEFMAIGS